MSIFGTLLGGGLSLLGAVSGSSSAKKAAQIQQQTTQQQIAANQANLQTQIGINQPAIDRGNSAANLYGGFLGVGDQAQSDAALTAFRGSTGYQDLLNTGLGSVNSNAYARGLGASGATLKALQSRGSSIANQSYQGYLGNLGTLIGAGTQAAGNVAGVSQNTTQANNQALQTGADASGNAALLSGQYQQQALQNLGNIGSSYAAGRSSGGYVSDPTQAMYYQQLRALGGLG